MKRIFDFLYDKGLTPLELFVALLLLSCVLALGSLAVYREQVTMPAAYQAWCKQTGNHSNLTYKEWRLLIEASPAELNYRIVFVPQPGI